MRQRLRRIGHDGRAVADGFVHRVVKSNEVVQFAIGEAPNQQVGSLGAMRIAGETRADARFGAAAKPPLDHLQIFQLFLRFGKGQLTAGLKPLVKHVTVFAGILLD